DVIDNASTRRGNKAAHMIWGNKASILVGDYIFSRAFQLLSKIDNPRILKILANTSNIITQGEIQQLLYIRKSEISIEQNINIIHHKTAALFEAATQMGPILANAEEEDIQAMAQFGHYLGSAFQIIDDILDYSVPSNDLGKNIGNDLSEGKITIPLIYAIQESSTKEKSLIQQAIQNGSKDRLDQIIEIIEDTNAITLSKNFAQQQIDYAMTNLLKINNSEYRDGLERLAGFVLSRTH
ncbi:MAG: polyprenyl synthetase family protein, partial [Legionellales bacterium]|nr:polyprenyl synthetase family protein [Legionellales bacterium]